MVDSDPERLARLVAALEAAFDAIAIVDAGGRYLHVNAAYAQVHGEDDPRALLGQRWTTFYRGEERRRLEAEIVPGLSGQPRWRGTAVGIGRDGRAFPQELSLTALEGGAVVWIVRDASAERAAERAIRESEERFRQIFEGHQAINLLVDPTDGAIVRANQAAAAFYGYALEELQRLRITDLNILPEELVLQELGRAVREHRSYVVFPHRLASGAIRYVEIHSGPVRIDGRALLFSIVHDVTERRRAEEALRQSEEKYRALFEQSRDAIYITSRDGRFIDVNRSATELFGYTREEMVGLNAREIYAHPDDRLRFQREVEGHGAVRNFEVRLRRKDGSEIHCLLSSTVRLDYDGTAIGYHGVIHDITARKAVEARLLHDAFHDALTGLANRALFMDRLERMIERSRRRPDDFFAVLFLDLDRFKVVNDSLGHLVGDQLLAAIARRLENCLRPGDTVARLGGDEFAILLDGIRDISDATRIADRILKELELPFHPGGHEVFTAVSIGIAVSATGYDRPEHLLRDADIALYRAKALGRGRHQVFDTAMHAQAVALLALETDLRRAVDRQEFRVFYQPIVRLADSRIAGFEALVRWRHPERGLLLPEEFIPLSEEMGLIIPIGAWVLREACGQLRDWQERFPDCRDLTMHVNLSGKQFAQSDLVEQVGRVLAETGLAGHCLKLEITESVVMSNPRSAIAMFAQLKAMGIQLCIDDFGTGYSSLSYLHRFPTDTLKIDRSFVGRIGANGENLEIIRTIVALAGNLGMDTIPEGVETAEHLVQLRALGCAAAQGYLFSVPLEGKAAEALLSSGAGRLERVG